MSVENEWKEKLCGCTDDCGTCCYGYWCTPCLFGSNAEKIDDQNCVLMCGLYLILAECSLCWIPHYVERQKLRKKYNLKEDPCHDCPTTAFCGPCALCQEAREMKARANQPGVAFKPNSGAPIVYQPGAFPPSISNPQPNPNPNMNPDQKSYPYQNQNQNYYWNAYENQNQNYYWNPYENQNQNYYWNQNQNQNQNQNYY